MISNAAVHEGEKVARILEQVAPYQNWTHLPNDRAGWSNSLRKHEYACITAHKGVETLGSHGRPSSEH